MKTFILFACVLGATIIVEGQIQRPNITQIPTHSQLQGQVQAQSQNQTAKATEPGACSCAGNLSKPVCTTNGQTFDNICLANCKKEVVECDGNCPCPPPPTTVAPPPKACPAVIRKVCGKNGTTFDNECLAEEADVTVECRGECPCNDKDNEESCPPCCTDSDTECQGRRADCSRCNKN